MNKKIESRRIEVFIGYQGSGKDYRCNQLLKSPEWTRIGFSDGVREATFDRFDMNPKYGKEYDTWKKEVQITLDGVEYTGRDLLLQVGESMRAENPLVWSEYWKQSASVSNSIAICVNDCRFLHEAFAVIQFADMYDFKIKFTFCDYKSDRYKPTGDATDDFASTFQHLEDGANITDMLLNLYHNAFTVQSWENGYLQIKYVC